MADKAARKKRSGARWEWDVRTDHVTWSDELYRIYGLEPREFRASYHAYIERVHPKDRTMVEKTVRQAMQDGRPFEMMHRLVRPDGVVRMLHARGEVERTPDGRVVRMFGSTKDVTDKSPSTRKSQKREAGTR